MTGRVRVKFGAAAVAVAAAVMCLLMVRGIGVGAQSGQATAPFATVKGQITDANGAAVADAVVQISDQNETIWVAWTDDTGAYELVVPQGTHTVTVEAKGFETRIQPGVAMEGTGQTLNVSLGGGTATPIAVSPAPSPGAQTGTITGTVTAANTNQPLASATVTVDGTMLQAVTDTQGRYSIRGVPAGSWTVTASTLGHAPGKRRIAAATGQAATANFALASRAIALDEIVVEGTGPVGRAGGSGSTAGAGSAGPIAQQGFFFFVQGPPPGTTASGGSGAAAGSTGSPFTRGVAIQTPIITTTTTTGPNHNIIVFLPNPAGGSGSVTVSLMPVQGAAGANAAGGVSPGQDFVVRSTDFSAQFGRPGGGIVNVITKRGTNDFHGTIDFYRNVANFAHQTGPGQPRNRVTIPNLNRHMRFFSGPGNSRTNTLLDAVKWDAAPGFKMADTENGGIYLFDGNGIQWWSPTEGLMFEAPATPKVNDPCNGTIGASHGRTTLNLQFNACYGTGTATVTQSAPSGGTYQTSRSTLTFDKSYFTPRLGFSSGPSAPPAGASPGTGTSNTASGSTPPPGAAPGTGSVPQNFHPRLGFGWSSMGSTFLNYTFNAANSTAVTSADADDSSQYGAGRQQAGQSSGSAQPPLPLLARHAGEAIRAILTSWGSSARTTALPRGGWDRGRRDVRRFAGMRQTPDDQTSAAPPVTVFFKSLGRSTGPDAIEMTVVGDVAPPADVDNLLVLEPVAMSERDKIRRELQEASRGRTATTTKLTMYCLNQRLKPPTDGQFMRLVDAATHEKFAHVLEIWDAADRARQTGQLTPDSNPEDLLPLDRPVGDLDEGAAFRRALVRGRVRRAHAEEHGSCRPPMDRAGRRGRAPRRAQSLERYTVIADSMTPARRHRIPPSPRRSS